MATGNMHKKLVKFNHAVFKLCERERDTHRHTYYNTLQP